MTFLRILQLLNAFCRGCDHDSDEKIQKTYENLFQANGNDSFRALLEMQANDQTTLDKSLSKPIRFTFDDSELSKPTSNNEKPLSHFQIKHVKRVLSDIKVFLAGFIKVLPE